MAEHRSTRDDFLDLDEDRPVSVSSVEQLDDQVAQAQDRLQALKRQAEQLEREKAKLKRLEILTNVQDSFTTYLHELEAINPKDWAAAELNKELSQALGAVEDARSVYTKAQAQVGADEDTSSASPFEAGDGGRYSFSYWLMAGFAFTLPLFALGLLGLFLWFIQLGSAN